MRPYAGVCGQMRLRGLNQSDLQE